MASQPGGDCPLAGELTPCSGLWTGLTHPLLSGMGAGTACTGACGPRRLLARAPACFSSRLPPLHPHSVSLKALLYFAVMFSERCSLKVILVSVFMVILKLLSETCLKCLSFCYYRNDITRSIFSAYVTARTRKLFLNLNIWT